MNLKGMNFIGIILLFFLYFLWLQILYQISKVIISFLSFRSSYFSIPTSKIEILQDYNFLNIQTEFPFFLSFLRLEIPFSFSFSRNGFWVKRRTGFFYSFFRINFYLLEVPMIENAKNSKGVTRLLSSSQNFLFPFPFGSCWIFYLTEFSISFSFFISYSFSLS